MGGFDEGPQKSRSMQQNSPANVTAQRRTDVPALRGHRSGCKSAWWFSIDEQLFAGLVFLSAAPHPVCAGSADTARKNAGAIAIRVGLAGILSKATAGRVVRRDRVELVGGTWPQEYSGERGTPLRHRNGRFRNGRIGGAEAVRDLANALGPDGPARRYRQYGRLLASSKAET
jgi:hypothetical protein